METNERRTRLLAIALTLILAFLWTIADPHDHGDRRDIRTIPGHDDPEAEPQGVLVWNLRFLRGIAAVPVADLDVTISVPGRRETSRRTDVRGCCKVQSLRMDDGLSRIAFTDPVSGVLERRAWFGSQIDANAETIVRIEDPADRVSLSLAPREESIAISRVALSTSSIHSSWDRQMRVTVIEGSSGSPSLDLGRHAPGIRGEIEIEWRRKGTSGAVMRRFVPFFIDEDRRVFSSDPSVQTFRGPGDAGFLLDLDLSTNRRLEGRLVDLDGRPVAGRWCAFLEPESPSTDVVTPACGDGSFWCRTDDQGCFTFDKRSGVRRREWEYAGTLLIVALEGGERVVQRVRVEGEGPLECALER